MNAGLLGHKRNGPGRAPSTIFEVNPAIHGQNGHNGWNSIVTVKSGHSVHSVQDIDSHNPRSGPTGVGPSATVL